MNPSVSLSKRDVCQWLLNEIKDGPIPSVEVLANARQAGIPINAIRSAKKALGIQAFKAGHQGPWWWGFQAQRVRVESKQTWEEAAREVLA